MLCVSNHITVSHKLMFLEWSLLLRVLDSSIGAGPPALCIGRMLEMLKSVDCWCVFEELLNC